MRKTVGDLFAKNPKKVVIGAAGVLVLLVYLFGRAEALEMLRAVAGWAASNSEGGA